MEVTRSGFLISTYGWGRFLWEEDGEGRSFSYLALYGNRAQMGIHNLLNNVKAQASSNDLAGFQGLYPIEFIEDSWEIFLFNSRHIKP